MQRAPPLTQSSMLLMQGLQGCTQDLQVAVSNYEVGCQQTFHETHTWSGSGRRLSLTAGIQKKGCKHMPLH